MDGPMLIMVPGILGGVVIAVAIALYRERFQSHASEQRLASERLSTDAINMASIRVAESVDLAWWRWQRPLP